MPYAYLIVYVNRGTAKVTRAQTASAFPVAQIGTQEQQLLAARFEGVSFHESLKRLDPYIEKNHYWLVPYLDRDDRERIWKRGPHGDRRRRGR
jgi:hypothetical protein